MKGRERKVKKSSNTDLFVFKVPGKPQRALLAFLMLDQGFLTILGHKRAGRKERFARHIQVGAQLGCLCRSDTPHLRPPEESLSYCSSSQARSGIQRDVYLEISLSANSLLAGSVDWGQEHVSSLAHWLYGPLNSKYPNWTLPVSGPGLLSGSP